MRLYLLLLCLSFPICAQQNNLDSANIDDIDNYEKIRENRLFRLKKEIIRLENKIFVTKNQIKEEIELVNKIKLESDLDKLLSDYHKARITFTETITEVEVVSHNDEIDSKDKTLGDEIKEILSPVIDAFKAISQRPKEIQNLSSKITMLKDQLNNISIAQQKLKVVKLEDDYKPFRSTIRKSEKELKSLEILYEDELQDTQFQFIELEKSEGSVVGTMSGLIFNFLTTKGKNLLLAIIGLFTLLWFFSKIRNKIINFLVSQISRHYKAEHHNFWFVKPVSVLYDSVAFLVSCGIFTLILYSLNDWVLVTFTLLVIGGLIWSSKQHIPAILDHVKLVLNLGAVREGELVFFNGAPWKVKTLGFYCRLVNPSLQGGSLRVSSKLLLDKFSRPIIKDELWFPTNEGDWIDYDGDQIAKVVSQTPEHVEIKLVGGAHKTYTLSSFLDLNPVNLSKGYGVEVILGMDYQYQLDVESKYLHEYEDFIKKYLQDHLKGDFSSIVNVSVDFNENGSSSLNYRLFIECSGKLAYKKLFIQRLAQKSFLQFCNTNKLTIPFEQLTVHLQNESKT